MATQQELRELAENWNLVIQVHCEAVHSARLDTVPKGEPGSLASLLANWGQAIPNIYPEPTEAQLLTALATVNADIAADATLDARQAGAKAQAQAIPNWATWTEAQVIDYITTNVTDLASAKTVLIAMGRMLVALRNQQWPDLEGS